MPVGRVKWFDPKRHFGFLIHEQGGEIFFHESDISEIDRPLDSGDRVIFRLEEGRGAPSPAASSACGGRTNWMGQSWPDESRGHPGRSPQGVRTWEVLVFRNFS